ncbi:MAG: response regulator [Armatimonadota bacterium]|nr:response regulator [Armatimonadota bacterium]MDR7485071.1 response regulator [Armatimonadota bacterium]MDR7537040.1 response regulator [Armatimonadota bacterium]
MTREPTVLVVDDDPGVRGLVQRMLTAEGYRVVAVGSAGEARRAMERHLPDVLLLDVMMPGEDGPTFCSRLRADPATAHLPVVFLTAVPMLEEMWLSSGADVVVPKPFNRTMLLSWIRRLVRVHRAQQSAEATEATLAALAAVIEKRSQHSAEHPWRVARYSSELARAAGLQGAALEVVQRAALLHDVGMIAVPESILTQPRALTAAEFEPITRHPVVGADLLHRLPDGPEMVAIVRAHHERWRGGGYPDGLEGEAIPLGARIIAIADAFDALTSDRPHRQALSVGDALEILWFGAESQWEPGLVELFDPIARAVNVRLEEERQRRLLLLHQLLPDHR